jgi:hypothetical protein
LFIRVPSGIISNTFRVKIFFSNCFSFTSVELFCHNYMKNINYIDSKNINTFHNIGR